MDAAVTPYPRLTLLPTEESGRNESGLLSRIERLERQLEKLSSAPLAVPGDGGNGRHALSPVSPPAEQSHVGQVVEHLMRRIVD